MKYAELIITLLKTLLATAGFFLVKKSGKDEAKLEQAQTEIEAINEAAVIKDSAISNPVIADKLRDRFEG